MKIEKTERGFAAARFTDRYGAKCSLQKSSLAFEDCIWLGVDDAEPRLMAIHAARNGVWTDETTGWVDFPLSSDVLLTTRMHLTRQQVAEMIPTLQKFVDTGDL